MTLAEVDAFERAGLKAWPGIEVEWDGHWVRRAAGGYSKRANSVQCYDLGDNADVEARIAAGSAWLMARGLRPVFRVTPQTSPVLLAALDADGWSVIEPSHQMAMVLGGFEADPRGTIYEPLDPQFLAVQQQLQLYSDDTLARLGAVLKAVTVPAMGIVLRNGDGEPVASAFMAVTDNVVVVGNVVTSAAHRRQGHAASMMRTGLAWAQGQGARMAALNVLGENAAAQALYAGLGFTIRYDYSYRVKATS